MRPSKLTLALAALLLSACVTTQEVEDARKKRAAAQLKQIRDELARVYYDREFGGRNMDSIYDVALRDIRSSGSTQERFRAISRYLMALENSHTYLIGGTPVQLSDFGFSFRFYGDKAFVTAVNSWGAAAGSGLRRGDEILEFAGRTLTRQTARAAVIDLIGQHPLPPLQVEVRTPAQNIDSVTIVADTAAIFKVKGAEYRKLHAAVLDSMTRAVRHITASVDDRIYVWKLPAFAVADLAIKKVAREAGKHETVIVDMRGNPGGPIARLEEVLGYFIDQPIDIGTMQMRWDVERFRSNPKRDRLSSKLMVLVDSETSSSAEVFTRLLQLQKRATVIGDRTNGAVMASMIFGRASITVSDFVLYNGERLEGVGVQPDIVVLPTGQQIADGDDPVLAHAITLAGFPVTAAQAGALMRQK